MGKVKKILRKAADPLNVFIDKDKKAKPVAAPETPTVLEQPTQDSASVANALAEQERRRRQQQTRDSTVMSDSGGSDTLG